MPLLSNSTKPVARPYWVSTHERASTRSKLLETARHLIARNGEQDLTLGSVADEAGLARATIYGYFTGKRDLLAALDALGADAQPEFDLAPPVPVIAEVFEADEHAVPAAMDCEPGLVSLAAPLAELQTEASTISEPVAEGVADEPEAAEAGQMAASVEDVPPPSEVAEPVVAEATAPEGEESPPVAQVQIVAETSSTGAPCAEAPDEAPASAAIELQKDEAEALSPYERDRRTQAANLEEIAKRLILPESALREGTDAVISRLETRLRVLERSITNLESRQQVVPDETAKKIKPIADVVAQLQSRADSIEDRQRQSLAELRLSIHELTARQGALGPSDPVVPMPVWPEATADFTPSKPMETAIADPLSASAAIVEANADNPRNAYLAAARTLAKEGARQAAELETQYEVEQRARRRRLLTAAGVAGVCLVAVGVLFVIRPGMHGVSTAQSKALAPIVAAKAHRTVDSRAPLDQLTALANKGDARAEFVIGLKYLKGDGIAANDVQAARWFERAAQSGDAPAQNHLGALYQAGRGVPADYAQAMHWYEAAASQGDRHAMSNLAILYAGGTGVPENLAEAARWFERSANLGYVDAQFNLAVLFERGDGLPQSLLDAYKWYSIAGLAGDSVAKARADAIATQISPEELQTAQQAAANFKPQPLNRAANDEPSMAEVLASAR